MSTAAAVQAVWWIGLVVALGLTAVALKLLFQLLATLRGLVELAQRIAAAAEGIATALSGPLHLERAAEAAEGLRSGAVRLREAATGVWDAVDGERPGRRARSMGSEGGAMGAGQLGGAAGGPSARGPR